MDPKREIERLEAELDAFTYAIAHDLRAPVRHIDGFIKLLEREAPPANEKAEHYLRTVANAATRLAAMVDDLAALSRLTRAPLQLRPVDLGPLVGEAVRELPAQGREVEWRIAALPVVTGDDPLLRALMRHLLANALKYTRPRSPAVIEIGSEGSGVLFVRDNGVGFDMRQVDRLFGIFQRLHRDEQFEGSGIGLAAARRIVHRHGGRIWGEGAPGTGATFRFTLGS
jgi:light-regulated signal transduction histidine kinase (bacteriophytochrome)